MINLAQRNIKTRGKEFASASDCLETWDDSDSITVVNARKGLETCYKNGGIATQKHNIKVSRSTVNIQKIVGTELKLRTINPIGLRISNT